MATSDLEEFVSAYLRDAPFATARFSQRVAQALGRCNRSEHDRAAYLLTDPEFLGRFTQRRTLDALPDDVRTDVYVALDRSDRGFASGLAEAERFLAGEQIEPIQPPARRAASAPALTATEEVKGMLALWREDYGRAASLFDRVAHALAQARERRAFWLAMRALALSALRRLRRPGRLRPGACRPAGSSDRGGGQSLLHPPARRRGPATGHGDRAPGGRPRRASRSVGSPD